MYVLSPMMNFFPCGVLLLEIIFDFRLSKSYGCKIEFLAELWFVGSSSVDNGVENDFSLVVIDRVDDSVVAYPHGVSPSQRSMQPFK